MLKSACVRGEEIRNSSLNVYKDTIISHNFWR